MCAMEHSVYTVSAWCMVQYMYNGFITAAFWNLSEAGPRLTDEELGYTFYGNRLVGIPRLRQLRVRDDTCTIMSQLKSLVQGCYGHFSAETESVKTYGKVAGYGG